MAGLSAGGMVEASRSIQSPIVPRNARLRNRRSAGVATQSLSRSRLRLVAHIDDPVDGHLRDRLLLPLGPQDFQVDRRSVLSQAEVQRQVVLVPFSGPGLDLPR